MRRIQKVFAALLLFSAACASKDVRQPGVPPAAPSERDQLAAQEARDRQELVTPAPEGWQPKSTGAQLKLNLFAEKTALRIGDTFRYRLEIQNIGSDDIPFYENPSFIKTGADMWTIFFKAYITFPDGKESLLPPPLPFADSLPPDNVDETPRKLFLTLHSGETVTTRARPLTDHFRALETGYDFDEPGRYRIRIFYSRPSPVELRAESNSVGFEIDR
jgi:hypothetical protein